MDAPDRPARGALLRIGLIGTAITALCCFTPILVVALGAVGLGAVTGLLDAVLLPALAGFIALTLYAWLGHRRRHGGDGAERRPR